MKDYSEYLTEDGFVIFLLHGVIREQTTLVRNYGRKHILVGEFDDFLGQLEKRGTCVSLPEVVRATECGDVLPPRAYVLTFDDGFENNLTVAGPVLRSRGLPATVYITSGFVENNLASWTDLLEEAVEKLDVVEVHDVSNGIDGVFATREEKIRLLDLIRSVVKADASIDPAAYAVGFRQQVGAGGFVPDPELDQKLNWDQVRALHADPLFTVGGHSHTHRILAFLETDELECELDTSLDLLQSHLGVDVCHYSYPEGLAHCYSEGVIAALRARGIVCSPSAIHGTNRVGDDLFHLRRIFAV